MIRKASVMYVYQDKFDEYKQRHDQLWPEMEEVLKEHGVSNYSIFLHEPTAMLFAYLEAESEEKHARIAETEVCQRWWAYMQDIMQTNPDHSPVSETVKEVFHLN
ncbi:L-rhamnose mutarotase [Terribacillus saccharophilus]|uniref:L-rhamnose mutarotase n=1 Tax=Terribacillus saccharophilus TaxID=361277 RepID=A0ABX4H266_9BACI|nr:L-rhamnose mutarotase [Terribacillus saccharophilus]PAD36863.1 L-rhamnose mutarotase [Terribacillus saccharophilus]PAD97846.1 L-rhamnose mutarotase [Terribacillus saccharophilus]PAE01228.1 L-rhamnose mutarotase [Terribacillus saccharophilus]